jgi:hypothetical protein
MRGGRRLAATLRAMDLTCTRRFPARAARRLVLAFGAVLLALALLGAPASAVEDPTEPAVEQTEEAGRPQVAATPRQQLALLLYGALALFLVGGVRTLNRQLKGERPQASGEFRWR